MNNSIVAKKMQKQIKEFSGILSSGLPKTAQRFVNETIYGIQARQSVKLTEIGRALNEKISLKKVQERLCRQIARKKIKDHVGESLIKEGSKKIKNDTLLIIDISDISKKYAEKMEYINKVHDGSDKKIGTGYWTVQIIGAETEKVEITPLYGALYSQSAPDFESENTQIINGTKAIRKYTDKGIYVMDRGGDRIKLIEPFLKSKMRFIIRSMGTRDLIYRGSKKSTQEIANCCPMLYRERIIKEDKNKEKIYDLEIGYRKVKIPGRSEQLYLVVVKGFGQEPLLIITNVTINKSRKSLVFILISYMKRWQIEETIRFAKQSYELEDIRILSYRRLQNMFVLVIGAMYFAAVWLGNNLRLNILVHHALNAAKRLFGIPNFRYYAIAGGIKEIFARYTGKIVRESSDKISQNQLLLFSP